MLSFLCQSGGTSGARPRPCCVGPASSAGQSLCWNVHPLSHTLEGAGHPQGPGPRSLQLRPLLPFASRGDPPGRLLHPHPMGSGPTFLWGRRTHGFPWMANGGDGTVPLPPSPHLCLGLVTEAHVRLLPTATFQLPASSFQDLSSVSATGQGPESHLQMEAQPLSPDSALSWTAEPQGALEQGTVLCGGPEHGCTTWCALGPLGKWKQPREVVGYKAT